MKRNAFDLGQWAFLNRSFKNPFDYHDEHDDWRDWEDGYQYERARKQDSDADY